MSQNNNTNRLDELAKRYPHTEGPIAKSIIDDIQDELSKMKPEEKAAYLKSIESAERTEWFFDALREFKKAQEADLKLQQKIEIIETQILQIEEVLANARQSLGAKTAVDARNEQSLANNLERKNALINESKELLSQAKNIDNLRLELRKEFNQDIVPLFGDNDTRKDVIKFIRKFSDKSLRDGLLHDFHIHTLRERERVNREGTISPDLAGSDVVVEDIAPTEDTALMGKTTPAEDVVPAEVGEISEEKPFVGLANINPDGVLGQEVSESPATYSKIEVTESTEESLPIKVLKNADPLSSELIAPRPNHNDAMPLIPETEAGVQAGETVSENSTISPVTADYLKLKLAEINDGSTHVPDDFTVAPPKKSLLQRLLGMRPSKKPSLSDTRGDGSNLLPEAKDTDTSAIVKFNQAVVKNGCDAKDWFESEKIKNE
ncbi:MAG: hypothetical protein WCO23_02575 [bacterium]